MIKRILVALSGTKYTSCAVSHALQLATAHGSELTGVTLIDTDRLEDVGPVPIGGGAAAHKLIEHRTESMLRAVEEQIHAFEGSCTDARTIFRVDREEGDPVARMTALWRYHDLTVFGLRGLFEYGVIQSPEDQIVRLIAKGLRPILAVPPDYREVRRVLIAYNGSMESAKAMKRFVQMRLWHHMELKVATFDLEEEESAPLLADAHRYCQLHGFEAETEAIAAHPRDGLLAHAGEWGADLVVMGSSSRRRIAKLILGDIVLHVMENAEIPLFLAA